MGTNMTEGPTNWHKKQTAPAPIVMRLRGIDRAGVYMLLRQKKRTLYVLKPLISLLNYWMLWNVLRNTK